MEKQLEQICDEEKGEQTEEKRPYVTEGDLESLKKSNYEKFGYKPNEYEEFFDLISSLGAELS